MKQEVLVAGKPCPRCRSSWNGRWCRECGHVHKPPPALPAIEETLQEWSHAVGVMVLVVVAAFIVGFLGNVIGWLT